MTPLEKASEIFTKMLFAKDKQNICTMNTETSKQCALVAVDELIESIDIGFEDYKSLAKNSYWNEVKQEIEKI